MTITIAKTKTQIDRCFAVMAELRPHINQAEFVRRVRRQQKAAGYQLVCVTNDGAVVAVAGFRVAECLAWGRFLYADDLVTTASARAAGYGGQLLDWLLCYAQEHGCAELHLDSGVQRFGAHRFYLKHGLDITCHHFARRLTAS